MRLSAVEIAEGATIPDGWGVAWYAPESYHVVALPVPFNVLAGMARRMYLATRAGVRPSWVDGLRARAEMADVLSRRGRGDLERIRELQGQLDVAVRLLAMAGKGED